MTPPVALTTVESRVSEEESDMRPFAASVGLALVLSLLVSACGGRGEPAATPAATATPIPAVKAIPAGVPTPVGARAPGQVRTVPQDLRDQQACYRLGTADAAQDQSAGATMEHSSPDTNTADTGFLLTGFGPRGEGLVGMPTTVAWTESGVIKVEVTVSGRARPASVCGSIR